jgi:hypothetical protein
MNWAKGAINPDKLEAADGSRKANRATRQRDVSSLHNFSRRYRVNGSREVREGSKGVLCGKLARRSSADARVTNAETIAAKAT